MGTSNAGAVGHSWPISGSIVCCERFDCNTLSCNEPWQVVNTSLHTIGARETTLARASIKNELGKSGEKRLIFHQ